MNSDLLPAARYEFLFVYLHKRPAWSCFMFLRFKSSVIRLDLSKLFLVPSANVLYPSYIVVAAVGWVVNFFFFFFVNFKILGTWTY